MSLDALRQQYERLKDVPEVATLVSDPKIRARASKYGVSVGDMYLMWERQGRQCVICREPRKLTGLVVDHNHSTGDVRGLLCSRCNTAIGLLGDNVDIVRSAVSYLAHRGSYRSRGRTPRTHASQGGGLDLAKAVDLNGVSAESAEEFLLDLSVRDWTAAPPRVMASEHRKAHAYAVALRIQCPLRGCSPEPPREIKDVRADVPQLPLRTLTRGGLRDVQLVPPQSAIGDRRRPGQRAPATRRD